MGTQNKFRNMNWIWLLIISLLFLFRNQVVSSSIVFYIDSKTLSRETNAFLYFSVRQGKLFTLTAISAVISGLPVWKPHHLSHSIIWSLLWSLCPNLHAHNNIWSLKYPSCFHQPNPRADHCISLYNRNHIAPWNLSLFIKKCYINSCTQVTIKQTVAGYCLVIR